MVLHYIDGLTFREIAEALAIPEGTATSRVRLGREALKKALIPLLGGALAAVWLEDFLQNLSADPVPPPPRVSRLLALHASGALARAPAVGAAWSALLATALLGSLGIVTFLQLREHPSTLAQHRQNALDPRLNSVADGVGSIASGRASLERARGPAEALPHPTPNPVQIKLRVQLRRSGKPVGGMILQVGPTRQPTNSRGVASFALSPGQWKTEFDPPPTLGAYSVSLSRSGLLGVPRVRNTARAGDDPSEERGFAAGGAEGAPP